MVIIKVGDRVLAPHIPSKWEKLKFKLFGIQYPKTAFYIVTSDATTSTSQ